MKKFLSLMLAVLLLVSALPFQAFATETTTIYVEVKTEDGAKIGSTQAIDDAVVGESYNAAQLLAMANAKSGGAFADYEAVSGSIESVTPNKGVVVFVKEKEEPTEPSTEATEPSTEATEPSTEATEPECEHPDAKLTFKSSTATCGKAGIATYECECGEEVEKNAAATGDHDYEDGVCTVCEAKEPIGLTFKYKNADGSWTSSLVTVTVGARINAPEVPSVSGLKHTGWDNNLEDGWTRYYIGMPKVYTATYVESTDDGLVDLTVYAYYYVDGEYHHKAKLFVEEFEEARKGNMVRWLYSEGVDAVDAALAAEHGADGYQWDPVKFYNCYDDGEVAEWDDLKTNGNKSVYVKVESKKAIEATILLHIHTAKEYAIARTVKMPGYTAGDFVSYNEALAKVKNYYTGSNLSMSDLYSESDWEDLMDGLKSSGSKTIKVEDNGTTEIHVIVKNATSKTSTNADPSNPKTGDYITIAVGTMAMAAAALVTLAELKKRKMI